MRVITLNPQQFADACHRLEALARAFHPDLILAIATGGTYVAREMFKDTPHTEVVCQRSTTRGKKQWLFAIIRKLPIFMRDWLRIAEAKFLTKRATSTVPLISDDISWAKKILVVDDAVDSGNTMAAVCDLLNGKEFATAAITVTTDTPKVQPDFTLYHTLIRFPWSKDV